MSNTSFTGKVLVVTGAGGQFGREGCKFFSERGALVAAMDKDAAGLSATVKSADTNSGEVIFGIECDVTNLESVEKAMLVVMKKFGRIDLLWNNAGYQGEIKTTLAYDPVDFARVMNVNVIGMFMVLQATAKMMVSGFDKDNTHKFSIVNTASVAGLRGTPAMIAYSSSKAAVLAMTVTAAKDLAPYNIRVNAISPALIGPGFMWTRQNELHAESKSPYFSTDPEQVGQAKVNGVPMKRLGSVNEVIKSVAFLLSEESSYTTGTNLVVDGGLSSGLKA